MNADEPTAELARKVLALIAAGRGTCGDQSYLTEDEAVEDSTGPLARLGSAKDLLARIRREQAQGKAGREVVNHGGGMPCRPSPALPSIQKT